MESNFNSLIIGIAGGSGSGKTTLARNLSLLFNENEVLRLSQDSYYFDIQDQKPDYRGIINFDCPSSIDFNLLSNHLSMLTQGYSIEVPRYDFKTHKRLDGTVTYNSKLIVIVEGILVLSSEALRDLFNLTIFLETPEQIRFQRRLLRDIEERQRTRETVYQQFFECVKPMHDIHVEPSKYFSKMILNGTLPVDDNMDLVIHAIKNFENKTINSLLQDNLMLWAEAPPEVI